jgi:hypothetical protein
MAERLGVFDDIWPLTDHSQHFAVSDQEIAAVRANRKANYQARKLAKMAIA